jgi:hypothetical protein
VSGWLDVRAIGGAGGRQFRGVGKVRRLRIASPGILCAFSVSFDRFILRETFAMVELADKDEPTGLL